MSRLRKGAESEAGFTLAELLVTIMLSMLVMALVTGLVQTSRGVLVTERARTDDLGVAFPAMDQAQRSLRSAVAANADAAVTVAGPSSVSFYTLVYTAATPSATTAPVAEQTAAQPRLVTLSLDTASDTLRMTTVDPRLVSGVWSWTGTSRTRVLARGVVNDTATPLFRYADDSGTTLPNAFSTKEQREQIAFVEVAMVVDTNNGAGRPVEVNDKIRLANYGTGVLVP